MYARYTLFSLSSNIVRQKINLLTDYCFQKPPFRLLIVPNVFKYSEYFQVFFQPFR